MTPTAAPVLDAFTASVDAAASVPTNVTDYRPLSESEFADVCRLSAQLQHLSRTVGAVVAGEIAHRSRPELGSKGLAQRHGHRTPEEMVRVSTGATGREATTAVRIGRLVHEAQADGEADPITGELVAPTEPWLAPVVAALTAGRVSVAAVDAIRSGLGVPTACVTVVMLTAAATGLCDDAAILDPDRLFKQARAVRDELDAAGIFDREQERRGRRGLRIWQLPDGMGRLTWDLDPETYVVAKEVFDRATSPRLGGPRFQTKDELLATNILDDPRTVEQIASDTFLHLLIAGATADTSRLLGDTTPAVRVLVTKEDLEHGTHDTNGTDNAAGAVGRGYLEGHPDPVSMNTVERIACSAGIVPIIFDEHGHPLDIGREQRAFTKKQRLALAARDGGCMDPNCERPPSWCEAHHIVQWHRDTGPTNIDDGILLCKHHHLLYHNNGWEIIRHGSQYWLTPPRNIDPNQTPILLNSKSTAYQRMQDTARAS